MKRVPLIVVVACTMVSGAVAQQVPQPPAPGGVLRAAVAPAANRPVLFRHQDVQQAWTATQVSRRPMFLYVTSDHCFYCKKMLKETLAHPQIGAGVAAYAEPVTINATEAPELARKLGVRAYPTTLVISPENKLLTRIEGFVDPQEFAQRVWPVFRQAEADRRVALERFGAVGQVTPTSDQEVAQPQQPPRVGMRGDQAGQGAAGMVVIQD